LTVDKTDVVDAIGIGRDADDAILTVVDHLEWDDANEHLLILQEKLNTYMAFIESGELVKQYPQAAGRRVRIDVCCKFSPSSEGARFLTRVRAIFEGADVALSWRVGA
jgi:hypothetical protein